MGGPVFSHSPLEGSGGAVMKSKTMCDGQIKTIATLCESSINGSSVFSVNSSDTGIMFHGDWE